MITTFSKLIWSYCKYMLYDNSICYKINQLTVKISESTFLRKTKKGTKVKMKYFLLLLKTTEFKVS